MDVNKPLQGLQQEGRETYRVEGLWVGEGGFLPAFGIKITLLECGLIQGSRGTWLSVG